MCVCVHWCVRVRACVDACVRACLRALVVVCVCVYPERCSSDPDCPVNGLCDSETLTCLCRAGYVRNSTDDTCIGIRGEREGVQTEREGTDRERERQTDRQTDRQKEGEGWDR